MYTLENDITALTDRPLAASGLRSYRYLGRYGWVMIGAVDVANALNQARRSVSAEDISTEFLQVWTSRGYANVSMADDCPICKLIHS